MATFTRQNAFTRAKLPCVHAYGTVNVTRGCQHRCIYCYAGNGERVHVCCYEQLPADMEKQIARAPERLYFSTTCDPFQPSPEVQRVTFETMTVALLSGRGVSFLTKGIVPAAAMDMFAEYPEKVFAQVGLITLDLHTQRVFEPGAASPNDRLGQMKLLVDAGIHTVARLDPMLPGLTDTDTALETLFAALRAVGVRTAVASYLFLRGSIRRSMSAVARLQPKVASVLSQFDCAEEVELASCGSKMQSLPRARREDGYRRAITIAARHDVSVVVCRCKNGDLKSGGATDVEDFVSCCEIAGPANRGIVAPPRKRVRVE